MRKPTIKDVAARAQVSLKTVSRVINDETGVHARTREQVRKAIAAAEAAERAGYVDQSHLIREFRRMTGCTPSAWLAEERRNIQDGGHRNQPSSWHE